MVDLKWLKTFITVVEEGSFRAAAEKLYISQPSITVHIKSLEAQLQVQLFIREHTKVTLAPIGQQYYPIAKKLLAQVEASMKEIYQASLQPKIPLVISVSPALLSTKILKQIHDFIHLHTQYDVEIVMGDQSSLNTSIRTEQIDVAIGLQKMISKDFHSERIQRAPMKLVYSSKLQLDGVNLNQQLKGLFEKSPLYIGYLNEHIPVLEELEREYGLSKYQKIHDMLFAIKLIKEGLGIGLLPENLISTELEEGSLQVLEIGAIASIYPIDIYMSHLRNNMNVISFLSYMRNQFMPND